MGGAAYLYTLTAKVPTAANAGYYAEIVQEKAILRRRLVEAGTRIAQAGYAAQGDVEAIVNRAQAEVFDVVNDRTADDYQPLGTPCMVPLRSSSRSAVAAAASPAFDGLHRPGRHDPRTAPGADDRGGRETRHG